MGSTKEVVDLDSLTSRVEVQLQEIQAGLFKKALKFRNDIETKVFEKFIVTKTSVLNGWFLKK